jgi:hypothetical protein
MIRTSAQASYLVINGHFILKSKARTSQNNRKNNISVLSCAWFTAKSPKSSEYMMFLSVWLAGSY